MTQPTTRTKRPIAAEDLYDFQLVSDPQMSPDGRFVIFCIQRTERGSEKKYKNLWIVPTDGGEARQFTQGDHTDSQPRWEPNGRSLLFLSNRGNPKQPQLYRIWLDGGEALPLTELQGTIGRFSWAPDGRKIVIQFRKKADDAIAREADEQKKKLGVVSRQITGVGYKMNGVGYLPDEKWHIWTVDPSSGEATQLTDGRYHETQPVWSPDSERILFVSNRSADPDFELDKTELYTIPADGGEMARVDAHNGRKFNPIYLPDGGVAYFGRARARHPQQNNCLYRVDKDGAARNLSAPFDLHLSSAITLTDTGSGMPQADPVAAADGAAIYAVAAVRGSQHIVAFDGQRAETVVGGEGLVASFSFDREQSKMAYLWGQLDKLGQLWLRDMGSGETRQLTHFNEPLLAEIKLGEVKQVSFTGGDGATLDGWITFPPDFDPSKQYPSILEIHGGPMVQYGRSFMHEFYYLAAQGYVVYWCNPRGGQGYGDEFATSIYGRWGTVDYDDIMAWADYMEAQPYIDPSRMGATGGSYGGYMTTMLIGRTNRFKTAVAQRVVSNAISFYGSSDMNWAAENLFGIEAAPWEDMEAYWRMSPMRYIGGATTPTLIIHSENDQRCPQEQGEQVYIALKRLKVETELLLLPEEEHGLSRNGRTDRRITRLNHILRWFDAYLK